MPVPLNDIREFDDTDTARANVYAGALDAVSKRFPVEDDEYRIELKNPRYTGPTEFDLTAQKQALMKDRRLHTPITGTWRLVHKPSNTVLDEREDVVMNIPYYTDRGTFINGGNEYSIVSQSRLRPGVYVRRQRTGEVEAHVNVRSGKGKPFRIHLEPSTGVFSLNINTSNIPLYPLLKAVGVSDQALTKAWGPGLVEANIKKQDSRTLSKIYQRIAGYKAESGIDEAGMVKYLREALPTFELDPEVNARTLGLQDAAGVTPDLLVRTTQKMLGVSRDEEDPDDRDATQFSHVYSVEDLVRERIDKDAGNLTKNLLFKARRAKSLAPITRSALNPYIDSLLLGSGLAMPLEETNPLHTLEQLNRITKLGEGGIGSAEAITDEARDVNPSQLGFVDPITGPEGLNIGIDVRAAYKTFKGKDNRLYAEFNDTKTGKTVHIRPDQAADATVAFPGQDLTSGKVYAMRRGRVQRVPAKEVDYEVPSFAHIMSSHTNLNPMPTAVQPGRQFYGAKFWSQYMPQVQGEVPIVDSLMPDGKMTFTEYYGRKAGTLRAKQGGTVTKVSDNGVTVTDDNGKKHVYDLVKDFPFNRMSVTGDTPVFIRRSGIVSRIFIRDYVHASGTEVLSYDPVTCKSAWMLITDFVKHRSTKRLFRVTLASGRSVDCTEDHSLLTLDAQFNIVPVYPLDCIVGTTRCPIVFAPQESGLTETWTYDVGVLDGLYLSEGSISQKRLLRIAVQPPERQAYVRQLVTELGYIPHKQQPGCVGWTDHTLARRWESDFGHGAAAKHIAGHVYGRGREYLAGLVAGYMAGDGCLHSDANGAIQVCAGTVSRDLQQGMIAVLTLLGIFATFTDARPNGAGCLPIYKFRVRSSDLCKLDTWFAYPDRQSKLSRLISIKYRADDYDRVPVLKTGRKRLYTAFCGRPPHYVYKAAGDGSIAKQRLAGCTGIIGRWGNSDILWDTVVDVSLIPEQPYVFDFSVAASEAFALTSGLLVHNTGISYFPAVEVGQKVDVGDMVAHSNFTDKKSGALNMGRNLKTAIIPYKGHSYEDAYVISESAAKKLATERLYGYDVDARHGIELGKSRYISAFPRNFTQDQVDTLDEHGVVKPGTVLHKGDPIMLAVGPKLLTSADAQLGRLHKVLRGSFTDKSQVWEYSQPGIVTDTTMVRNGAKVNIKSTPPVDVGDKLSTRFGLKGVVGKIVPDDEMPRDVSTNEPYELLLNPMAVLSRLAPNQVMEMALGKLAHATGKQIRLPQTPPKEGWAKWVKTMLAESQVNEATDIFDPDTGKTVKNIGDGRVYVSAFHHLAEKKLASRGDVGSYTADEQPARGGHTGAKKFSQMDVNAALAHGATDVIKDVVTIRGTKNEEFWKALKLGRPLPEPGVPFIYTKFLDTLRAGGINVSEKGDITSLLPMTDADITALSKGVIDKSDLVDDSFEPIPGGLFDAGRTGGTNGNRWTHINLPEPVPNPVMEEPVRRLLGLKVQELEDVLAGRTKLDGKTGGAAIQAALKKIDIDDMIAEHKQKVRTTRGSNRDNSIKVLGYLSAAKQQGIHPSQWVISKVPVLPPVFRPVSRMGDVALIADLNELYRDVLETSKAYTAMKGQVSDDELADERLNLYKSVQAAFGLGDPITPEGQSKRLKGAIRQVIGTSPKFGMFQSKVISKPVDVVGRGVVTPDPNLDMDQIGIPADSAWELYKDFVLRELVRHGYPTTTAVELIDRRSSEALDTLKAEMQKRPVIMDRAPTWHKFNLLAFYPHIIDGHTIRVSPLVTKGFNMDFDGDQANFHVPVSAKAVEQTKRRMLPSANLFSLTDLKSVRHSPSMEMTMGLYWLTRPANGKPVRRFRTVKDAEEAYRHGELGANDPIEIG